MRRTQVPGGYKKETTKTTRSININQMKRDHYNQSKLQEITSDRRHHSQTNSYSFPRHQKYTRD